MSDRACKKKLLDCGAEIEFRTKCLMNAANLRENLTEDEISGPVKKLQKASELTRQAAEEIGAAITG